MIWLIPLVWYSAVCLWLGPGWQVDTASFVGVADSLHRYGVYGINGQPNVWRTPLVPCLIYWLQFLPAWQWWFLAVNVAAMTVCATTVYELARPMGRGSAWASMLVLLLLCPQLTMHTTRIMSDNLHVAMFTVLCAMMLRQDNPVTAGAMLGLCLLCRPVAVGMMAVSLIHGRGYAWRFCAAVACVYLPWVVFSWNWLGTTVIAGTPLYGELKETSRIWVNLRGLFGLNPYSFYPGIADARGVPMPFGWNWTDPAWARFINLCEATLSLRVALTLFGAGMLWLKDRRMLLVLLAMCLTVIIPGAYARHYERLRLPADPLFAVIAGAAFARWRRDG